MYSHDNHNTAEQGKKKKPFDTIRQDTIKTKCEIKTGLQHWGMLSPSPSPLHSCSILPHYYLFSGQAS